ncbi:MAG TPA: hypothetical protein VGO00_02420, partial [Kofleriaceae bacterium]|nr:hypothetical protein [Kofleriaceae bacterium]
QAFLDGDRDLSLRRKLAAAELATARAALAAGNGTAERRDAIRAAGRALALEPTDRASAELVARLMLEPPADIPAEVDREVAARDRETLFAARRLISRSTLGGALLFPAFLWAGLRDPIQNSVGIGCLLMIGLTTWLFPRSWSIAAGRIAFVGWAILTAVVSSMLSPFLLAVGLVPVIAMTFATHPAVVPRGVLFAVVSIAALGPWLLGPDLLSVSGHDIIIHATTSWLDPVAVRIGLATFVVSTALTGVILARGLTEDRRAVQRRVEIQAWQLRQLVPEPTT